MNRQGFSRRKDIPKNVMDALNEGNDESRTLTEWLAIDQALLLNGILSTIHINQKDHPMRIAQIQIQNMGIMDRLRTVGTAICASGLIHKPFFKALTIHQSNVVREWSAMAIGALPDIDFETRLRRLEPFATDHNMSVREVAWFAWRPHFEINMKQALPHLQKWVESKNPNLRRCAIEGCRPRGVWVNHIRSLKVDPSPCLDLLEICRADNATYVQKSVANWLNDASKSRPEWVLSTCKRWLHESPNSNTKTIVWRATRTLRKQDATCIEINFD